MHIALGSDHAGSILRGLVKEHLKKAGHSVEDLGTLSQTSVDYPEYAQKVARAVADDSAQLGVLVCGTGIGMCMVANRVPGVRAAVCTNEFMAQAARSHNDANVLCLGERVVGAGVALSIVDAFIGTPFEGGRHARRVEQINDMDRSRTVSKRPKKGS